jgi:hypothetical protein
MANALRVGDHLAERLAAAPAAQQRGRRDGQVAGVAS